MELPEEHIELTPKGEALVTFSDELVIRTTQEVPGLWVFYDQNKNVVAAKIEDIRSANLAELERRCPISEKGLGTLRSFNLAT